MNDATDRSPEVSALSRKYRSLLALAAVAAHLGCRHWNRKPEAASPSVTFARRPRRDNI